MDSLRRLATWLVVLVLWAGVVLWNPAAPRCPCPPHKDDDNRYMPGRWSGSHRHESTVPRVAAPTKRG
jgi:hypothetical protein